MGRRDPSKPRTKGTYLWCHAEYALPRTKKFASMCAAHEWWYEKTDCGLEEYDRWNMNEAHLRAIAKDGGEEYEKIFKAKGKETMDE